MVSQNEIDNFNLNFTLIRRELREASKIMHNWISVNEGLSKKIDPALIDSVLRPILEEITLSSRFINKEMDGLIKNANSLLRLIENQENFLKKSEESMKAVPANPVLEDNKEMIKDVEELKEEWREAEESLQEKKDVKKDIGERLRKARGPKKAD